MRLAFVHCYMHIFRQDWAIQGAGRSNAAGREHALKLAFKVAHDVGIPDLLGGRYGHDLPETRR